MDKNRPRTAREETLEAAKASRPPDTSAVDRQHVVDNVVRLAGELSGSGDEPLAMDPSVPSSIIEQSQPSDDLMVQVPAGAGELATTVPRFEIPLDARQAEAIATEYAARESVAVSRPAPELTHDGPSVTPPVIGPESHVPLPQIPPAVATELSTGAPDPRRPTSVQQNARADSLPVTPPTRSATGPAKSGAVKPQPTSGQPTSMSTAPSKRGGDSAPNPVAQPAGRKLPESSPVVSGPRDGLSPPVVPPAAASVRSDPQRSSLGDGALPDHVAAPASSGPASSAALELGGDGAAPGQAQALSPRAKTLSTGAGGGAMPMARPVVMVTLSDEQQRKIREDALAAAAKRDAQTAGEIAEQKVRYEFHSRDCEDRALNGPWN